mmetsp:Transcript_43468/g.114907  ORF Transcript_43468/g.114907 Transcript_43468/m.114907 type:complete len:283 (+) Transcript_43468:543-1391(+)
MPRNNAILYNAVQLIAVHGRTRRRAMDAHLMRPAMLRSCEQQARTSLDSSVAHTAAARRQRRQPVAVAQPFDQLCFQPANLQAAVAAHLPQLHDLEATQICGGVSLFPWHRGGSVLWHTSTCSDDAQCRSGVLCARLAGCARAALTVRHASHTADGDIDRGPCRLWHAGADSCIRLGDLPLFELRHKTGRCGTALGKEQDTRRIEVEAMHRRRHRRSRAKVRDEPIYHGPTAEAMSWRDWDACWLTDCDERPVLKDNLQGSSFRWRRDCVEDAADRISHLAR